MQLDYPHWQRAVESRDGRFDGWIYLGVTSTRIYCRPSCPAMSPKREHMRFYATPAAAQRAGFRACKRCRPDAAPGSPEWNARSDVVARAMRLIADGVVDREGVAGLARRLGYSERHLNRLVAAELGAGPLAIARARRAQTARVLIETTDVSFASVALGAGFSSIRQFNDTIREVFALTPTELRRRANGRAVGGSGRIDLRLPLRQPFDARWPLAFLAERAVDGVEEAAPGVYRRVLDLPHGPGLTELADGGGHVRCTLRLADLRDLGAAVERSRRLLDLDADPRAVDGVLAEDPLLAPLVAARPGIRVPGAADPHELAFRAVLGQQVSVRAARTQASRLALRYGVPLEQPDGALRCRFPTAAALAQADPDALAMPASRRATMLRLADALATGELALDAGADRDELRPALLALPGIGPWTASYIAMRALGDPDAFPAGDLGLRHALARLGGPTAVREIEARAERWRPFRAYALQALWASLGEAAA